MARNDVSELFSTMPRVPSIGERARERRARGGQATWAPGYELFGSTNDRPLATACVREMCTHGKPIPSIALGRSHVRFSRIGPGPGRKAPRVDWATGRSPPPRLRNSYYCHSTSPRGCEVSAGCVAHPCGRWWRSAEYQSDAIRRRNLASRGCLMREKAPLRDASVAHPPYA